MPAYDPHRPYPLRTAPATARAATPSAPPVTRTGYGLLVGRAPVMSGKGANANAIREGYLASLLSRRGRR